METTIELTRAMTLVLIVLAVKGANHGYAIMLEIPRMTSGDYHIGAGTLYRSIAQMVEYGFVEEAPELFNAAHDDERRKYYRITSDGRSALSTELQRIEKLVKYARKQ